MNYKYDFFISYNIREEEPKPLEKWINNLTYYLELILTRLLLRKPIYKTSKNISPGSQDFNEIIKNTATFIIVVTNEYLELDENKKAFELIINQLSIKTTKKQNRLFKILKSNIPSSIQPKSINKLLSHDFFIREGYSAEKHELGSFFASDIERHFWFKLLDLAYDLSFDLCALQQNGQRPLLPKTVFLAETSDDQVENRDIVKRELLRFGYKVLPDKRLPDEPLKLRAELTDYLGFCSVSVHIIGEKYGEVLQNSKYSKVELQNLIAADYYRRVKDLKRGKGVDSFSRFIWLPPDLKLNNEEQRIFVEKLKLDNEALSGADVLETPIELLKTIIKRQAEENAKLNNNQDENSQNDKDLKKKVVYYIFEKEIAEEAEAFIKWLKKKEMDVRMPVFEGNKLQLMNNHRKNLIESDGIIIEFRSKNTNWLRSKLLDLIKSPGYGKQKPFKVKALVVEQKDLIEKQVYENHDLLDINIHGDVEDRFADFFKYLSD